VPIAGGLKSFPTAEGYGRFSLGGRGGSVCAVTTLADSGAGSLRDCLTRTGPRTVVFRVGGTILVNSTIQVRSGRLTIAGQTAPGGGIQIRNGGTSSTAVQFMADDIIVRHVRFSAGPTPLQSKNNDALYFAGNRGMFDHVTARWATDENADIIYGDHGTADVTVQWSIIAEPMNGTVAYPAGHAYCMITGGARISLLRSLLQDCVLRGPAIATRDQFDMINTVVHNWSERSLDVYAKYGKVNVSAIGNWWQMGANSRKQLINTPARLNAGHNLGGTLADYSIYARANRSWSTPDDYSQSGIVPAAERSAMVSSPMRAPSAVDTSAEQGFRDVMQFAGAMPRDSADVRIVNEARTCTGKILQNENDIVGGFPVLANGTPYPDADKDGMDDRWEAARGITDGNADADGDGYTNLEEFLNELAGDQDSSGKLINRVGTGQGVVPAGNCGIKVS
jgi:hypothetical protein